MKTYKVTVDERGTIRWYNEKDQLHREDGPAIICTNGYQSYYINGKLHREDGPAVIDLDGSIAYFINDKYHREDGPAVIRENGDIEYFVRGKRHREDGPAIIYSDGSVEYWIDGVYLTKEEFESRNTKEVTMEELHKLLGYAVKIKE